MSDSEEKNKVQVRRLVDQVGRRESELASAGTAEHRSLGGHAHQNVRQATAELLETANQYYQHMKPTESFPEPAEENTLFYVLTDSGVLSGAGHEDDLGHGRHPLSPLFYAGHRVITQLRLISESVDQDV